MEKVSLKTVWYKCPRTKMVVTQQLSINLIPDALWDCGRENGACAESINDWTELFAKESVSEWIGIQVLVEVRSKILFKV